MTTFDYTKFRYMDRDENFLILLINICRRSIKFLAYRRSWPASVHTGYSSWNDSALDDVTVDFVFNHLVEKGKLDYLLDRCADFIWFSKELNMIIVQYMANRARKLSRHSEEEHLRRKTQKLLMNDSDFYSFTQGFTGKANWLWGLSSIEYNSIYPADIDNLKQAALIYPSIKRINYRKDSKKMNEIVKKTDLKKLLVHIFKSVNQPVLFRDLFEAVKIRIPVSNAKEIPINTNNITDINDLFLNNNIGCEMAAAYFKKCNDDLKLILYSYFCITEPGKSTEYVMKNLNVKKSQARNYINNALEDLKDFVIKTEFTCDESKYFLKNLRLFLENHFED